MEKQKQIEMVKEKEIKREQEKKVIDVDVRKMEDIRLKAHNLVGSGASIREEILKALEYTKGIRSEFDVIKQGATHLQAFDN